MKKLPKMAQTWHFTKKIDHLYQYSSLNAWSKDNYSAIIDAKYHRVYQKDDPVWNLPISTILGLNQ